MANGNGVVINGKVTPAQALKQALEIVTVAEAKDISFKFYSDRRRRRYLFTAFGLDAERLDRAFPSLALSAQDESLPGKPQRVTKIYLNY